jgi:hypothetical protein
MSAPITAQYAVEGPLYRQDNETSYWTVVNTLTGNSSGRRYRSADAARTVADRLNGADQ